MIVHAVMLVAVTAVFVAATGKVPIVIVVWAASIVIRTRAVTDSVEAFLAWRRRPRLPRATARTRKGGR